MTEWRIGSPDHGSLRTDHHPMRLVLFDIDGTLITDGGASRSAYRDALRAVYGYEGDMGRYDFSGRTDPQITYMVLRDAGLSDDSVSERIHHLWEHYLAGLARKVTPERVRVLPGIRLLLDTLHTRVDVMLGLLTGNIEPGARLKLGAPGLNHYFPFGAFGSDSADREKLAPIAAATAAALNGHPFHARATSLIPHSLFHARPPSPRPPPPLSSPPR